MPAQTIGVTATELFACNPYRVLGVAVNATSSQINENYQQILAMAENGTADSFTSPFDFSSLPPFQRTTDTVKTAYAKLASNGYRCFAYSDSQFTMALNIDDVMLNIRDVTCYDCFLRCYMWLVINDREMEEEELWINMAKVIDKMIAAAPEQYEKYFDNRFPDGMNNPTALRSFHSTFCEIILLPLKEMVRGSMRCQTAAEILTIKGIDVNQTFDYIEIPQANVPKPGEPAPKLKIALKDGDEYFDISTGKMMSFESENSADIESNVFAQAAAPITAAAIINEPPEEEPEPVPAAQEVQPQAAEDTYVYEQPQEEETPEPAVQTPVYEQPQEEVIPEPAVSEYTQPEPQPVEVKQPAHTPPPAPVRTAPAPSPAPAANKVAPQLRKRTSSDDTGVTSPSISLESAAQSRPVQTAPQLRKRPSQESDTAAAPTQTAPKLMRKSSGLMGNEGVENADAASEVHLTDEAENEENLYTDALIQMLRANRSRNQLMKDVDTRHAFNNGDVLESPSATPELTMEGINMKKYDSSLLASPYETEYGTAPLTREEKYKNIKIDDMLNPTLGNNKGQRAFQPDAIEEFKKHKAAKKSAVWSILKIGLIIAVLFLIFIALNLLDIF